MNERGIKKLRRKFIRISFLSLLVTMIFIGGLIYFSNLILSRKTIRNTLNYIVEMGGHLDGSVLNGLKEEDGVEAAEGMEKGSNPETSASRGNYDVVRFLKDIFYNEIDGDNPEFYYTTRYFSIIYSTSGEISEVYTNHIAAVSETEAKAYGNAALYTGRNFGRDGDYYYKVAKVSDGRTIVVYLDSSDILSQNYRILFIVFGLIVVGVIAAGVVTVFFSKWAIAPEIRNVEIQKSFITNASHELKTPLAVIRANTEMQEMLNGESEWTDSTMRQVDRMSGLMFP